MKQNRTLIFILTNILFILPISAYSNGLHGLVYLIVIWPLGALFLIILFTLCIISFLKLKRQIFNKKTYNTGVLTISMGVFVIILFPMIVFNNRDALRSIDIALLSVIPVAAIAIVSILLGFVLLKKSKKL